MPRYLRSRDGEFQTKKHKRSFTSANHMINFLNNAKAQAWEPFKKIATEYATNKRTPPRQLNLDSVNTVARSHPRDLVKEVVEEFNSFADPERDSFLEGGIADVIHTIGHETGYIMGIDKLLDIIGI